MAKILTVLVLAAGIADIAKAITGAKPEDLAADILEIEAAKAEAIKIAEQAKADLDDALALNDKHVATIEDITKNGKTNTPAPQATVSTFEHDGETYGFKIPKMSFKGRFITADDVCADKELQAQLIKIGSGMIYKK